MDLFAGQDSRGAMIAAMRLDKFVESVIAMVDAMRKR